MSIFIQYTPEQKNAITQLRRAFNRCKKVKLGWHNEYGTLQFFPRCIIEYIDDKPVGSATHITREMMFEEVDLDCGEWSDDAHFAHFTDKGAALYLTSKGRD